MASAAGASAAGHAAGHAAGANAAGHARASPARASTVAHMVLGAPILLTRRGVVDFSGLFPGIPDVTRRKRAAQTEHSRDACMLLPQAAEFFSVVVDSAGGVYIQPQGGDERVYCIQPQFSSVARLLPGDSACRVIVYPGSEGALTMGMYDMARLGGVDLQDRAVLERHAMLHDTVNSNFQRCQELERAHSTPNSTAWEANVRVHWVGWQEACVRVLGSTDSLPFKAAHMCRLDDNEYVSMLTPIRTDWQSA
jgi:hypothetical protein